MSNRIMNFKYKRILIIQTAFLGDVILITPLIRAVKQLFPRAEIDALVVPQSSGVLVNNPNLRNILTFDKRKNKVKAFWKTMHELRKNKYDLAISPHSSTTTAWLMVLACIPERVGFDRWHASKYLTHKVPHYDDRGWHKVQKLLHLLTVFSDREFDRQTELFPSEQDQQKAKEITGQGVFAGRPAIAMAPGSIWNTKRWPEAYYTQLAKLLYEDQYNLIFMGGKEERDLCARIVRNAGAEAQNLAGQTSILESAALAGQCDLMICNDSGALHIANAMKTDVFVFFGPTVQSIGYFPFRENDVVFELEMECRPCGSHGGDKCPLEHHKCMVEISPEMVYEKITERFT